MISEDTQKELIEACSQVKGSIRDKEVRFCQFVMDAILRNHGKESLKKVWFRTECGNIGDLKDTPLEKWYEMLDEFRITFWNLVEEGKISGHLPGSSLPTDTAGY